MEGAPVGTATEGASFGARQSRKSFIIEVVAGFGDLLDTIRVVGD